jgi:hypothetical protein
LIMQNVAQYDLFLCHSPGARVRRLPDYVGRGEASGTPCWIAATDEGAALSAGSCKADFPIKGKSCDAGQSWKQEYFQRSLKLDACTHTL